jgi:hypothetical protein
LAVVFPSQFRAFLQPCKSPAKSQSKTFRAKIDKINKTFRAEIDKINKDITQKSK